MLAARRPILTPLLSLSLLFLLTLFVLAPLTRPGFPQTAAGFQPVWELNLLAQGGGWPALTGEADMARGDGLLPRYMALLLRSGGADGRDALKATLALAYLLGGFGVYGWLRRRWGEPAALLAGVVYTFLPYRLAVTYIAGGLGDAWAMALFPWAGWALDAFAGGMAGREPVARPEGMAGKKPALHRMGLGVLSLAAWVALAACNVGLAVWFALIAGVALLAEVRQPLALLPLAPAVPALVWGILRGGAGDFHSHYPYLFQLFSASWNSAPSGAGWINEMPFQLGLVPLGLAGLALAWSDQRSAVSGQRSAVSDQRAAGSDQRSAVSGQRTAIARRPLFILAFGIALAVLLSLRISAPFWRITRLDHILTYPWQMLGFAGLGLALLAGSMARVARPPAQLPMLAGLIALAVLSVYPYLSPAWTELTPRAQPAGVFGDGQVALADYRLIGKLYPGAQVQLDVTWQALRRLDGDYTVFVQALDATQKVRGQFDGQPRGGSSPTSQWVPGQIITDTVVLRIDPSGPAQGYQLIIGFYDWQTGRRLPAGADDKVMLSEMAP